MKANAQGLDSMEHSDERPDVADLEISEAPFPGPYGDEADFSYWKYKAVELHRPYTSMRRH